MYKNATKCNETIGKWCKNKHGASKIIDTFETYQRGVSHAQSFTLSLFCFILFLLASFLSKIQKK
jgi:hypothetical protein